MQKALACRLMRFCGRNGLQLQSAETSVADRIYQTLIQSARPYVIRQHGLSSPHTAAQPKHQTSPALAPAGQSRASLDQSRIASSACLLRDWKHPLSTIDNPGRVTAQAQPQSDNVYHLADVPIHDHHRMQKTAQHRKISNVCFRNLPRMGQLQIAQRVW